MSAPDPDIDRIADQILTDLDLEILDRDLADWLSRDPARRSVFIAELYRLASGIGDYWDHSFVNFLVWFALVPNELQWRTRYSDDEDRADKVYRAVRSMIDCPLSEVSGVGDLRVPGLEGGVSLHHFRKHGLASIVVPISDTDNRVIANDDEEDEDEQDSDEEEEQEGEQGDEEEEQEEATEQKEGDEEEEAPSGPMTTARRAKKEHPIQAKASKRRQMDSTPNASRRRKAPKNNELDVPQPPASPYGFLIDQDTSRPTEPDRASESEAPHVLSALSLNDNEKDAVDDDDDEAMLPEWEGLFAIKIWDHGVAFENAKSKPEIKIDHAEFGLVVRDTLTYRRRAAVRFISGGEQVSEWIVRRCILVEDDEWILDVQIDVTVPLPDGYFYTGELRTPPQITSFAFKTGSGKLRQLASMPHVITVFA